MKTNAIEPIPCRVERRATRTTFYCVLRLMLLAALLSPASSVRSGAIDVGGKRQVDAMTINLYLGAGTGPLLALNPADPGYLTNLVATVTGIYYEVLASQPPVRLQGVANEIARRRPDLVAVEEASLIRTESPGDLIVGGRNPATHVVFDYLQILVDALANRGARYAAVSTDNELDVELPLFNLQTGVIDDVRLTDRNAILVRTDLPPGQLRFGNPQHGNFKNVVQIPSIGLSVLRGWCSVDASLRGEQFRFICTHLEEETVPQIQLLQALELLDGPAQSNLPVILSGDFNADTSHRNGTHTYDALIAAGFTDTWAALHPTDPLGGLTWGHDELLADPGTAPVWRIDLILFRGNRFGVTQAEAIDITLDRTQPPFWASDHLSVAAQLQFQPGPKRLR